MATEKLFMIQISTKNSHKYQIGNPKDQKKNYTLDNIKIYLLSFIFEQKQKKRR